MKSPALLILGLICAGSASADSADDVRCREIGFSKSVEKQDHELFASFIDPDARFVSVAVNRARDAIAEAWSVFFTDDGPVIKWRPIVIEVLESGDLALSRGPYRIIDKDENGELREGWGTFNSVWRLNEDGEWLVVFDAGSFPDENPTDEQRALLDAEDDCG
jgi:ketosteroid isomerase-like protein